MTLLYLTMGMNILAYCLHFYFSRRECLSSRRQPIVRIRSTFGFSTNFGLSNLMELMENYLRNCFKDYYFKYIATVRTIIVKDLEFAVINSANGAL